MDTTLFDETSLTTEIEIGKTFRPGRFATLLVQEGSISLKYNLSDYEVGKNSVLFLIPNSIYEFSHVSDDVKLIGITFSMKFLSENGLHKSTSQVMETFASGFQPFYEILEPEFLHFSDLIKVITAHLDEDLPFASEKKRYGFLTLFYEGISIFRKYNVNHKVKLNRPQELSIKFLRLLSSHFQKERSVQFYAELLFVTPRHLTQTLKQITGRTAGDFIDRAVIMEAKLLLKVPSKNIGQVAAALHFSDQFFFAKFFKKHTGLTPTQYRSQ